MKKILFVIAVLALTSCEKQINVDLNSSDPQIVIEGSITSEPGPYQVKISKTVNFSDANNYPPVPGALVIISDNIGTIDTLTEMAMGLYQTKTITGQPGRTYTLQVHAEGRDFYARSIMPQVVNLDTINFIKVYPPGADAYYAAIPVFTDPIQKGNNYRFVQTVNAKIDNAYYVSNDVVANGLLNQTPIYSEFEIMLGDTVNLSMRCVDQATYTYFFTLSEIEDGTTPSNPPTNITGNNALGFLQPIPHKQKL